MPSLDLRQELDVTKMKKDDVPDQPSITPAIVKVKPEVKVEPVTPISTNRDNLKENRLPETPSRSNSIKSQSSCLQRSTAFWHLFDLISSLASLQTVTFQRQELLLSHLQHVYRP